MDTLLESTDDVNTSLAAAPSDAGYTFVEIVISISLIGVVVLGIMAAARTSVMASSTSYERSQLETVLINAADKVSRAEQVCDYEAYVDAAATAHGWDASTITARTERLVGADNDPIGDWQHDDCLTAVRPFDVQRIAITATTPDGKITRSMIVVKSSAQ